LRGGRESLTPGESRGDERRRRQEVVYPGDCSKGSQASLGKNFLEGCPSGTRGMGSIGRGKRNKRKSPQTLPKSMKGGEGERGKKVQRRSGFNSR